MNWCRGIIANFVVAVIALPTLADEAPDLTPYIDALSEQIGIHAGSLTSTTERRLLSEGRRAIITAGIRGYLDRGDYVSARAVLADKRYYKDLTGDLRHALTKEIHAIEIEQNTILLITGIYDKSVGSKDLLSALRTGRIDVAAFKILFDILTTLHPHILTTLHPKGGAPVSSPLSGGQPYKPITDPSQFSIIPRGGSETGPVGQGLGK